MFARFHLSRTRQQVFSYRLPLRKVTEPYRPDLVELKNTLQPYSLNYSTMRKYPQENHITS